MPKLLNFKIKKMKQKTFFLLAIIFIVAGNLFAQENRGFKPVKVEGTGTTTLYEQSHALIIGNSNYTNGWNDLPGVKIDVAEVKTALEQNGFHVVLKQDLTKEQMDKAFSDFIRDYGAGENNRLLFYYAGHGFTVKSKYGGEVGYIVPIDAPNPNKDKSGFQAKAMEMSQIETYAERIDSKHALFIFDACFAGSLFAMRDAVPAVINYKTKEPVRQFITSGSADETVPDKSIFREQFVIALTSNNADANNDGYLTGTELGKFLQDNVVNYSYENQHPQYGKIRNQYLDKGDFVFVLNNTNNNQNNKDIDIDEQDITPLATYGNLQINNYLQGNLYIDGTYKQTANKNKRITITDLPTGKHIIKIQTDDETWQEIITITENQTVELTAKSTYTPPKTDDNKDLPNQFTDNRDGKVYKIVEIGDQVWLAENLAYKPNSGNYWAYKNDQSNVAKYGYLYDWETAKNVCPDGYHLPTDAEWTELTDELGGESVAGKKLKSETNWKSNGNGTNESGFNAFAGGYRDTSGSFINVGNWGYWWSVTPYGKSNAMARGLLYDYDKVNDYEGTRAYGFSVRCLRD